ncbi:MAG: class I SAM-dependent methyltransferase [Phycisphaerales bacterium JB039]
MPTAQREYVLGVDQQELERLGTQHRLWADAAHRLWMRARLLPGQTVLDIGCGPGYAALEMAQIVGPSGRIVGVDESAAFVARAREQAHGRGLTWLSAHEGDVQDLQAAVSLAPASVDLAYARWVLCFVPDPGAVLDGAGRLLKPQGRIALQDYFNYEGMRMAPERPAFNRVRDAAAASWRARGGDPDVMGRMPRLLRERGFAIDSLEVDQRIARPGHPMWVWPEVFWRSFVPRLIAGGFLSQDDANAFSAEWAEAAADPDTFFQLPPVYEIVAQRR